MSGRRKATTNRLQQLLTADDVAELLRVSRSCVYKLSRLGDLPSVRVTLGRSRCARRWRESDVLTYIESRLEA